MNQRCVVKVGGANLQDPNYLNALAGYVQYYHNNGYSIALVHGGGKEISEWHERLGLPFEKKQGLRVTSPESMKLVTMLLCGLINKRLVSHMSRLGIPTVGLSGLDFRMMQSQFLNEKEYGRVGTYPVVNPAPLKSLLDTGHLVVVSPVCAGPDGDPVNVNADAAAQSIAVSLDAHSLDFVTDVSAVKTKDGPLPTVFNTEISSFINNDIVRGGMIPKLQAGAAALEGGVNHVRVGNLTSLVQGTATKVRLA